MEQLFTVSSKFLKMWQEQEKSKWALIENVLLWNFLPWDAVF